MGRTQCCRCQAASGCVASGLDHTELVFSLTQDCFFVWTPLASYGAERVNVDLFLLTFGMSCGAEKINSVYGNFIQKAFMK